MITKVFDNNYLLRLFNQKGVYAGLNEIDVDKIHDPTIQIIARTIKFSTDKIIEELETRTAPKK